MNDIIEMNIKFYQVSVKNCRMNIWNFGGAIFLNIVLIGMNIPFDSLINKIALGVLGANALWQLFFLWDSVDDYKLHKEMLYLYKKHNTHSELQESIKSYNSAKEYYVNRGLK